MVLDNTPIYVNNVLIENVEGYLGLYVGKHYSLKENNLDKETQRRIVAGWAACMYVYIYSPDMDIQKYTVTMKIIVNSVKISSPIGTISNSEVVDLQ